MVSVFVLDRHGSPLTPTTPARARKLMRAGVACPCWSKLGTFGIRLTTPSRNETPPAILGYDPGAHWDGLAIVVGDRNVLCVTHEMPFTQEMKKKEDRVLCARKKRRNCRRSRRPFANRKRALTPLSDQLASTRNRMWNALTAVYPVRDVVIEAPLRSKDPNKRPDVARLVGELREKGFQVSLRAEHRAAVRREMYGYRKPRKGSRSFGAHCADALAVICEVRQQGHIRPGPHIVAFDSYRPAARRRAAPMLLDPNKRLVLNGGSCSGIARGTLYSSAAFGRRLVITGRYAGTLDGDRYMMGPHDKRKWTHGVFWLSRRYLTFGHIDPARPVDVPLGVRVKHVQPA